VRLINRFAPYLFDDSEQKCGGQAEEQPSIQGFQGSHELPFGFQSQSCVPKARDRIQRIENRKFEVWESTDKQKGFCPKGRFDRMEAGGNQGRGAHYDHEPDDRMATLPNTSGSADGPLAHESEPQHVDHHRQNDERHTPGPIVAPGTGVNVEKSESRS